MQDTVRSQGFTGIRVEGGILSPEFLNSIASLNAPNQSGADYGLSPSLSIKEELARFWRIGSDFYGRYAERRPRADLRASMVGIEEWLVPFLRSLLGYEDIAPTKSAVIDDRIYKLSHRACGSAVPLLLVTRDFDLDKADQRLGHEGRQQSPHGTMQEYLNAEDRVLWGVISNGSKLRVLRDNPSLTRPSYLEADLDLIFEEELYSDFSALWLTAHASRLSPVDEKPAKCIIESWRANAHKTGERAKENLRENVTETLLKLGNGFLQHPTNTQLRTKLIEGSFSTESYFQQLLRLVYRLLFLFTAEEREILHSFGSSDAQRTVYQQGYSLSRLRERAGRRRNYDQNHDLWSGLKVTFAALAKGAPDIGLPALGGLFRPDQCPDLDGALITNEHLLMSIHTLAFFRSDNIPSRVNYRDMDSEELGSIYESLLELRPDIEVNATPWNFLLVGGGAGTQSQGSERKLTGSYYTPSSLVNELVKSTLDPVIEEAIESQPDDPRAALLGVRVLDPACGSGHFLLAAARRLAKELARIETSDDSFDESARQHALREVVQHCIYGVDRNPLAVELCKTALWIETIDPGKPLTFLDAHIVHGDSLVGILDPGVMTSGIPADAYKALTGDDKKISLDLRKRNAEALDYGLFDQLDISKFAASNIDLDSMPEDTLIDVERKRTAWQLVLKEETRAREELRANLFVGAFFAPKTSDQLEAVPQTQDLHRIDEKRPYRVGVEGYSQALAERHRFLHWHLTFAEVMRNGGFDVVLGNPPWERIKLQEREFFATRSSDIANAPNKAARDRLIQQLRHDDALPAEKSLYDAFEGAKRESEAVSLFIRKGKRFELTNVGDLNTYAVFAETCLQVLHPRGRAGLVIPTGIATDDTTKAYFEYVINRKQLTSLIDFENREAVFPSVHRSYKFCLLSLCGRESPANEAEFAFFLHHVEQLMDDQRRFTLTAEDFELFNPNTRTCPTFRTNRDMEVARKLYQRAGVLWKEMTESQAEANPWGVSFHRMFDMSNDSHLFKTAEALVNDGWVLETNEFVNGEERYLPLYEAKLFHQYDHRYATFEGVSERDIRNGNAKAMTPEEKSAFDTVLMPRYWVPETEVATRLELVQAKPSQAKPSQAKPSQAKPSQAKPSQAKPSQAIILTILSQFVQNLLSERSRTLRTNEQ